MELDILKQNTTWNDASASINNNFAKVKTAIEQGGGGGGSIAVDKEMSDTSENAVSNKTIKKYVDEEAERVVGYAEEVADNAEKAAKKYADDNKVAKVEGKQLSTEDFTTTLKQKLDGLNNYDDAYVRSAIAELQNNLDAIVNGDATSAIDSIQEILAFLSTITDTQTLAGIVADLKQYVDDKIAAGGGGGITEEKEVYIGSDEPSDAKLWVDTDEEDEPSAPSGIKIYIFPSAAVETMRLEGTYTFSAEETAAFHRAYADRHNTIFMIELKGADATISGGICSIMDIYETGNNSYLIHFPVDSLFANIFNYEMTLENQDGLLVFYV